MATQAKQVEKKTIAEVREDGGMKPATRKKEQVREHNAENVTQFMKQIGIELTEEQARECELHLRLKVTRIGKSYIRTSADIPADLKLGPQQKALVEALSVDKPMSSTEWALAAAQALNTRQDPMRVLNFYKRELESKGLIQSV